MSTSRRWISRPPGSNWGDFGADDQLGRINLLTPAKVKQGISEVREGIVFTLSLPLDVGYWLNPSRFPPRVEPVTMAGDMPMMNYPLSRQCSHYTDLVCDDAATIDLQFSTQWDALGHVGTKFDADSDGVPEMVYYNGYRAYEDILGAYDYRSEKAEPFGDGGSGLRKLGIENMARHGMQGRGVMIDLHRHFGMTPHSVGYDDLMRVLELDKVAVEEGDLICLRTGLDRFILDNIGNSEMPGETPGASLNGRDEKLLQWVSDSGLAALMSDHAAVETYPAPHGEGANFPMLGLHELCLVKLGIPIGELWYLSPLADWLAANGRSRFLLTAPPLNLPGAAGSPVTPVATV
jgi:Putative cyclase